MPRCTCRYEGSELLDEILYTSSVRCFYVVGRLEMCDGIEVPGVLTGSTKVRNYGHAAGHECLAHISSCKSIRLADEKCAMGSRRPAL